MDVNWPRMLVVPGVVDFAEREKKDLETKAGPVGGTVIDKPENVIIIVLVNTADLQMVHSVGD